MVTSGQPSTEDIESAIERLAHDLAETHKNSKNLAVIGIAGGGITLARRLARMLSDKLGRKLPCGVVDISFHRDDISSNPVPNIQSFANLPFAVDDSTLILVDDVIFTGRTIRAALNEIFDQGRPDCVRLAVLVNRGGRCLPIQPDFAGLRLQTGAGQRVDVSINDDPGQPDSIAITN